MTKRRAPRREADRRSGDRLGLSTVTASALLLPVVMDPQAGSTFELPKAEILGILAYATAAALALVVIRGGWRAIPMSWMHVPVIAYLGVVTASAVGAVDPGLALWGDYERRLGLLSSLQFGVLYLGTATFIRDRAAVMTLFGGTIAGAVLVLAYAIIQRIGLDPVSWATEAQTFSTLGNSNVMGHYFSTIAAATFAGVIAADPWSRSLRYLAAALALVGGLALGTVLSGARAPLLGIAVGILFATALVAWRGTSNARHRRILIGLTLSVVLSGAAIVLFTPVGGRIAALASGTDTSVAERALIYQTVVEIVRDRPVLGVGPDNLAAVYGAYRPPDALRFGTSTTQTSAHGWPWRVALDSGLLGVIAFGAVVIAACVVAIARLRQRADPTLFVLLTGLVTFLAGGLFTVGHLGTDWFFWVAVGAIAGTGAPSLAALQRGLRGPRSLAVGLLAIGLVWPVAILLNDLGASRAFALSRPPGRGDPAADIALARKAADADGRWPAHWNNLGLRAVDAGDRSTALIAFERAAETGGYDPLIWKNLGTVQAQLSAAQPAMRDRAVESARRAIEVDPRNPEAHAAAAQVHLILGDAATSIREGEFALSLLPGNDRYLELVAAGYLQLGRVMDARTAIESALAVGETWQRRLLLARVHVAEGRLPEARTQLARVLAIDPGNRSATALLGQIGR